MKTVPIDHLFLFAGEPSGDLHGSYLLKALKQRLPQHCVVSGVGGPYLRSEGIQNILDMEDFAVMGFIDVLRHFPKLFRQFSKVRDYILTMQPDLVILIDYPGFNLRLAKALRKQGFRGKIVQYISPSVWAWGQQRIQQMAETLDLLLTIFPFEPAFFAHTTLPVKYVGNPSKTMLNNYPYRDNWQEFCGLNAKDPIVGVFPGSRSKEIATNLPLQLETAALLQKEYPEIQLAVSCSNEQSTSTIQEMVNKSSLQNVAFIPRELTYELMRGARCALAKSGTVTLELALQSCPTVVMYHLSEINRWIAQYVLRLRLPHYCIANILLNKTVFPEFIQQKFDAFTLYQSLKSLYLEGSSRESTLKGCQDINELLQDKDASLTATQAIEEVFL